MTNWRGVAQLRAEDGSTYRLTVQLRSHVSPYGRQSWAGAFQAGGPMEPGEYTIVVDGVEGAAIVNVANVHASANRVHYSGTIVGSGPAPF